MVIYRALFPNGKSYIGQTHDFNYRQHQHFLNSNRLKKKKDNNGNLRDYEKENNKKEKIFYNAIIKYGWDVIVWTIIDEAETREELNQKEIYWINYYRTYVGFSDSNGYNANLGGEQYEKFSSLNEKELKSYGDDYRKGMSLNELKEKYNLPSKENRDYYRGKRLSTYTGIKEDISLPNSVYLNRITLKQMLEDFKENGSCVECAKKYNISKNDVYYIVTGRRFQKYTGIIDDSFFKQYRKIGLEYNKEDIDKIVKFHNLGYTTNEIFEKMPHLKYKYIQDIIYGRILSKYTGIAPSKKEERKYINPINSKLTKDQVLEIIHLNNLGMSYNKIGKQFGVNHGRISEICNGKTWSYVTGRKYNPDTKTYDIIDIKNP